jgi:hypothetical protein
VRVQKKLSRISYIWYVDDREKLVLTETIGSVLWFVMDGFWMLNAPLLAKTMILPTLLVNLLVFRYTKQSFSPFSVVAAMNSWLLMNIFWTVGDLDKTMAPLVVARTMYALGLILLVLAVAKSGRWGEGLMDVLSRFRRLRTQTLMEPCGSA